MARKYVLEFFPSDVIRAVVQFLNVEEIETLFSSQIPLRLVHQDILFWEKNLTPKYKARVSRSTFLEAVTFFNILKKKGIDPENLENLETLDLSGSALTTLPERVFEGLVSLRTLYLSGNALTTLPEGVFEGLGSLQYL